MRQRKAFTIMEIIFIIVIIGILAAIAVPKYLATRSDAKVSVIMMKIGNIVGEISSYATSQVETTRDLSKMSNSVKEMVSAGEATLDTDENSTTIKMDGVDCVKIAVIHTDTNDDLNVSLITSGSSNALCRYLQEKVSSQLYKIRLRGTMVEP